MHALTAAGSGTSGRAPNEVFICGLPGQPLADAIEFVRQSLAQARGTCTVINVNMVTDDTIAEIEEAQPPVLLWSDNPDGTCVSYLTDSATPVILLDYPFATAAYEFIADRQVILSDALRVLAQARTGWWSIAKLPRSIIVRLSEDFGAQMVKVLSPWLDKDLPQKESIFGRDLTDNNACLLTRSDRQAISHLDHFYGKLCSEEAIELTVPLQLLFDGHPPHGPLDGAIELVGPVRALSFGPFLFLPEGNWKLEFEFATSLNRSGNSLMFDLFVDHQAKNASEFNVTSDCRLKFTCEFEVRDPRSTFEFRSHLRRGSIEGKLEPLSLQIRKLQLP